MKQPDPRAVRAAMRLCGNDPFFAIWSDPDTIHLAREYLRMVQPAEWVQRHGLKKVPARVAKKKGARE